MKKFISMLLIISIIIVCFSITVTAKTLEELEPQKVIFVGEKNKINKKLIKTKDNAVQNIELSIVDNIDSKSLSEVTNIIVDKESYDELPNNEKRDVRRILNDELRNNKRISFYGDNEDLNLSDICDIIDYNFPIIINSKYDKEYNIFSYSFDKDKYGNIKMTRLIDVSESAISEEEKITKISNFQESESEKDQNDKIETQIVTGGIGTYNQTYTDLLINSKNCDTLLEVYFERVKKGTDYTKWYVEAKTIIDPVPTETQLRYAQIAIGSRNALDIDSGPQSNSDDECVTNFSPKNANNQTEYNVGVSADLGIDPKLGVLYETKINIKDCEIVVLGSNKYKAWGYTYKCNSPLSMGSSEQMGTVVMKNNKSTFNAMIQVGVITNYTNSNQSNETIGWQVADGNLRLWTNRHTFTDIK